MATRRAYIERILRAIYGGQPSDDSQITVNLVNAWLPEAIATAAKTNYTDSIKLDGVAYINNGFYSTFSGIAISSDATNNLGYKLILPEIPLGLGKNEGISTLRFKGADGFISQSVIWLSANQVAYANQMRKIPNKICAYNEGSTVRFQSSIPLTQYTAVVSMVSGGDSSNLDSEINVPQDYFPLITEYMREVLMGAQAVSADLANDGIDKP